jgi:hypothetical protein
MALLGPCQLKLLFSSPANQHDLSQRGKLKMAAVDQAGRLFPAVRQTLVLTDPQAAIASFQNQFFLPNDQHQVVFTAGGLAILLIYKNLEKCWLINFRY